MIIFYGLSEEFRKARNFFEKGLDKCVHLCYNIIMPIALFLSAAHFAVKHRTSLTCSDLSSQKVA